MTSCPSPTVRERRQQHLRIRPAPRPAWRMTSRWAPGRLRRQRHAESGCLPEWSRCHFPRWTGGSREEERRHACPTSNRGRRRGRGYSFGHGKAEARQAHIQSSDDAERQPRCDREAGHEPSEDTDVDRLSSVCARPLSRRVRRGRAPIATRDRYVRCHRERTVRSGAPLTVRCATW